MKSLFALGDVHGESRLLASLLAYIDRNAGNEPEGPAVYFLGDIVDRGPDSRGALDLVCATLRRWPLSRLLLGNHDQWFLDFLRDPEAATAMWLDQGGRETIQSYDLPTHRLPDAAARIRRDHPVHVAALENASLIETVSAFAFVHAGIDPSRSLFQQSEHDCLWIRAPFLEHVGHLSHIVVHGHTPQPLARPVVTENRVSVDTGACFSGVLSAFALDVESGEAGFLAARRDGSVERVEPTWLDRGLGTALPRRRT